MTDPRHDLLLYYSKYYAPGVIDLSSSNPPPRPLEVPHENDVVPADELSYVPPRGPDELRAAIASRYESTGPDDILVSCGASEALAALALALVEQGDRVCVDRGTYPSFTEAARTAGGEVELACEPRPGTKVAVVCNPTTPDGKLADMAAHCAAARAAGALAIVDEVYRDLVHDGRPARAAVDCDDYAVSVGGLSKPLGLGGLRIGWIATHNVDLLEALDRQLQLLSGGPASLSVEAALAAFEEYDATVARTLCDVQRNAPRIYRVLDDAGWQYERPVAGLTVEAQPPYAATLAGEQRVREAGMFLIPCEMYANPGAYRISLLADSDALARAVELLRTGD